MAERYFSSYKSLFRIKWKIYAIGDKPLPRPLPVDLAAAFLALLPFAFIVAKPIAPLFGLPPWAVGIVFDSFFTYAAAKIDPQGRSLIVFCADAAAFLLRRRVRSFCGLPVRLKKAVLFWEIENVSEEVFNVSPSSFLQKRSLRKQRKSLRSLPARSAALPLPCSRAQGSGGGRV